MRFVSKNLGACLVGGAVSFALAMACSGGENWDGEITSETAPINRGTLVTSNTSPFTAVFRLRTSESDCTALKITTNRYLTAAHCLQRANCSFVGAVNRVDLNNALDANGAGTSTVLATSYIHPSYVQDPTACNGETASHLSYDVAIIETTGDVTPSVTPATAFWPNFVDVGTAFRQVGYGENFADAGHVLRKQYANYTSVSDSNVARYAHVIRTSAAQSGGDGDSGGPLFYQESPGTWRVAGVTSGSSGKAGQATGETTFARVANVGRWIDRPHNASATNDGIGFFQSLAFQQCLRVSSSAAGTAAKLSECEGYDPRIHGQLWEVVASGSYFQIRTKKSGVTRCLDVQVNTNNVVIADCTTSTSQQWAITPFLNSSYTRTIKNRARSLYLSDAFGSTGLMVSPNTEAQWMFYR